MKVHYSRFRMLDVKANFSMNELLHEHEEIVEIVEKRQRERCGEVMRYHLEGACGVCMIGFKGNSAGIFCCRQMKLKRSFRKAASVIK